MSLARLTATVSGIPGGADAVDVVATLSGAKDEQTRLLESIAATLELIRSSSLKNAYQYLESAALVGPADPEWRNFVTHARDCFYEARSVAASPAERAVIELDLHVVARALDRDKDAAHWLAKSQGSADEALREFTSSLNVGRLLLGSYVIDKRPGHPGRRRGGGRTIPTVLAVPLGLLFMAALFVLAPFAMIGEALRRHRARTVVPAMTDFLRFYNLVQHTQASETPDFVPVFLQLKEGKRDDMLRSVILCEDPARPAS